MLCALHTSPSSPSSSSSSSCSTFHGAPAVRQVRMENATAGVDLQIVSPHSGPNKATHAP